MLYSSDTIAAISTAMNNSGIGIIRISGEDAFNIIKKIFRPANPEKEMDRVASHTVHYGNIADGDIIADEVLVLIMKGPHTYTREDTVEIDCHGGMYVMNRVMELVLKNGARTAEPGEFTRRAFMNGRIDLTQAEAVIDVINAENDFALKSAVTQLKGSVSEKIRKLRAVLLEQIAYIEAALDDPEHIEMEGYGNTLLPIVRECSTSISELIKTADDGRIIKEGINTVILGKPNAGKSSLLNALVGSDRAIVTEIAGTTRDVLEESIRLGEVTLNIFDTAGIRNTQDIVEKIGVNKAREYAKDADLIVWLIDASRPLDEDDREIAELIKGKKTIILLNKQDLPSEVEYEDVKKELSGKISGMVSAGFSDGIAAVKGSEGSINMAAAGEPAGNMAAAAAAVGRDSVNTADGEFCETKDNASRIPVISISALTHEGLDTFVKTVRDMFYRQEINFNDQVYITNLRQKEALAAARESLDKAVYSIQTNMPEDFFTIDLMDAYASLGSVTGEAIEDDLADEIFAKFCMGK